MKLYEYKGTLEEISNMDNDIILSDVWNDAQPPVKIRANTAMHNYLWERSSTDDEEKYIKQNWVYDRILLLQYIEIPSTRQGWPAKVIASANPTRVSMDMVIFGDQNPITTDKPEPMSREELMRWQAFRQQHNLYDIH